MRAFPANPCSSFAYLKPHPVLTARPARAHQQVSSAEAGNLMPFTPYMSIVLGVTVSLFLCLFMSICKRLIQRHGLFGHPVPEQTAPFMGTVFAQ